AGFLPPGILASRRKRHQWPVFQLMATGLTQLPVTLSSHPAITHCKSVWVNWPNKANLAIAFIRRGGQMARLPLGTLTVLAVGMLVVPVSAAEPFRFPEAKYGGAELRYVNGIPVLTVAGSPEEMGEAVGVLALRPGSRMACYPEDLLKHYHLSPLWA